MKGLESKITRKLVLYFLLIILVFSLMTSTIYLFVGQMNLQNSSITYVEKRAEKAAASISNFLALQDEILQTGQMHQNGQNNQRNSQGHNTTGRNGSPGQKFLTWMNELLASDILIVDKNKNWVDTGAASPVQYADLTASEQAMIEKALLGETSSTPSGNLWQNTLRIQVASPLIGSDNNITGAILYHEDLSSTTDMFDSARSIFLLSLGVGMLLVVGLAIFFANRLLAPLNKLHQTVEEMTDGKYTVTTGIHQEDEIGELADGIDTLAQRLEAARLEAKSLDAMRDDFISSMSHELKTPVTVMKSSLEALNQGVITVPAEVEEYHSILYREGSYLEKLIANLLDLSMLRNRKYSISAETLDLVEIIHDAVRSQRPLAKEKDIHLVSEIDLPYCDLQGDYTRLRQMLLTVLNNAVKYSPNQSEILVTLEKEAADAVLTISNTGATIPEETLGHIFEPFVRDKNTDQEGFGLGLAIAKEIADRHAVRLTCTSKDGLTRFAFRFPPEILAES